MKRSEARAVRALVLRVMHIALAFLLGACGASALEERGDRPSFASGGESRAGRGAGEDAGADAGAGATRADAGADAGAPVLGASGDLCRYGDDAYQPHMIGDRSEPPPPALPPCAPGLLCCRIGGMASSPSYCRAGRQCPGPFP